MVDISQWDERDQTWWVCFPQVWLRNTFQYVHTCQLLWYSAAPRKWDLCWPLALPFPPPGAHAEVEGNSSHFSCTHKQFYIHAVCLLNSFCKCAPLPLIWWDPIRDANRKKNFLAYALKAFFSINTCEKYFKSGFSVEKQYGISWYIKAALGSYEPDYPDIFYYY